MDEKLKCQGWCGPCENQGSHNRQNTAYAEDKLNWKTFCPDCQKESDVYWKNKWEDYCDHMLNYGKNSNKYLHG